MSPAPVLVPRPAGRADSLRTHLEATGLQAAHHPFLELRLEHDSDLRRATTDLAGGAYDLLALTSARAVDALTALSPRGALVVADGTDIAVVGEGTAEAVRAAGAEPSVVADGSGRALVDALPPATGRARVLFPASSAAAATLEDGLGAKGYQVQRETAYRPRTLPLDADVLTALRTGGYSAIVLTSGMIARLAAQLPVHRSVRVVSLGPVTTTAAREAGLTVHAEAHSPTDEALARAVRDALTGG